MGYYCTKWCRLWDSVSAPAATNIPTMEKQWPTITLLHCDVFSLFLYHTIDSDFGEILSKITGHRCSNPFKLLKSCYIESNSYQQNLISLFHKSVWAPTFVKEYCHSVLATNVFYEGRRSRCDASGGNWPVKESPATKKKWNQQTTEWGEPSKFVLSKNW